MYNRQTSLAHLAASGGNEVIPVALSHVPEKQVASHDIRHRRHNGLHRSSYRTCTVACFPSKNDNTGEFNVGRTHFYSSFRLSDVGLHVRRHSPSRRHCEPKVSATIMGISPCVKFLSHPGIQGRGWIWLTGAEEYVWAVRASCWRILGY